MGSGFGSMLSTGCTGSTHGGSPSSRRMTWGAALWQSPHKFTGFLGGPKAARERESLSSEQWLQCSLTPGVVRCRKWNTQSRGAHTHRCDKDFSRKKLLPPPAPILLSPVHTEYRLGIALAGENEEREQTGLASVLSCKQSAHTPTPAPEEF